MYTHILLLNLVHKLFLNFKQNLIMRKLILAFMGLIVFESCDEVNVQDESIDNPVLKLLEVKSLDLNPKNGRVLNSDVSELKEITINLDGQEIVGRIAFLNGNLNTQRIAMLGSDDIVYSYVDITDNNGILSAKYYTYSGELYLEATLQNETINIVGAYNLTGLANGRTSRWLDRFESCVDDFVGTISSSPEWGAVMVVGMATGHSEAILAGLAIGCGIYASS